MTQRQRRDIKETGFRLRYAIEQMTAALRQFTDLLRQGVEEELARSRAITLRRRQDMLLIEAEYQAWRKQQEEQAT